MTLWALKLEYHGAPFVGWQRQGELLSVQSVLEGAAARLNGNAPVASIVAGRTDAGVHAAGQVAQITLPDGFDAIRLREALNFHMKPHPVVVIQAAAAPEGWNARFSAIRRSYRYRILNRRSRPALMAGGVWHVPMTLDVGAMAEAASLLLGHHDFTSFRAAACQAKSPMRTLDRLDVRRDGTSWRSRPRRAASCTTRCGTWLARCGWSATEAGRCNGSRRLWPPETGVPPARPLRPRGCA